ncbi:MAG: hypothetical protein JWP02_2661 [Acidimicrobiales bacterium]|nr:hypothetical protein [Acidimicrobiales bacterium]
MRKALVAVLALGLAVPGQVATAGGASAPGPSAPAYEQLQYLVNDLSPAPEYRRFGSAAMAAVADYAAGQLAGDGFTVVRNDVGGLNRWAVDYTTGHEPLVASGTTTYKTESGFEVGTTPPEGITCTLKKIADVRAGDCGLVPFAEGSPEWKNPFAKAATDVATIKAQGGIGAVIQGDVPRNLVYALKLRSSIPAVVSVVPDDIVGKSVTLRAMGSMVPAVAHNVVGVLRPPLGSSQYITLLGHMDGWFQAAADNGGGTAAILRAAHLLATRHPATGIVVGLMDGEEYGLYGSKAWAQQLSSAAGFDVGDGRATLHMTDLKAVVNLDASSARASDVQDHVRAAAGADAPLFSWRAMVHSEEPTLTSLFLATFAAHQVLGLPLASKAAVAVEGGWRTDAQWFHQAGVPVAWPVAGYPEYHTDGDVPSAMDSADLEAVADSAADLVGKLATAPIGRVPDQFR